MVITNNKFKSILNLFNYSCIAFNPINFSEKKEKSNSKLIPLINSISFYSTVTDFAKFLGLSTSHPLATPI